jgi:hypothetical protein
MFTKALWGDIHGTLVPRFDAANIDPPPLRSDTANIDPQSLVSGLPRVGGGSPANFQPPPPSPPRKLMFTVTLPAGEFDSDSNSQVDTDSFEDHFHGYIPPVPQGDALRVFRRFNGCLVCPNLMHRWRKLNEIKDHVLGMAKPAALR